jgi:RNA polymerase sigma-70 factor (ECF subfamily)
MRPTDADLLAAARERPEALGEFYDRYEAAVAAYFMRRTRHAATALELTAETFAEVVLQCHRGVRVAEPTGWLFTIAQSKLADLHRRGAVDARARRRLGMPPVGAEDEGLERVEALLGEPRSQLLTEALAQLPDEQREAVLARVVEERSYGSIAADLQTTEQVVRKRVSRGLAVLRRRLKETS